MILVGDINLLGMGDPSFPFAYFEEEFGSADIVFGNLECCLHDPLDPPSPSNESFIVPTGIGGEALKRAGMRAVGIANNINFTAQLALGTIVSHINHCVSKINKTKGE